MRLRNFLWEAALQWHNNGFLLECLNSINKTVCMKKMSLVAVLCSLSLCTLTSTAFAQKDPQALKSNAYTYVDLNTGETISVYYDTLKWVTVNKVTTMPVDWYVIKYTDRADYDTVHGVSGIIANGMVVKTDAGWAFDDNKVKWDGNELKMKDRYGRKVKWEAGEMKIKDWNSKYKSEKGDDTKFKQEWDKVKWKEDGSTKVEIGTGKVKSGDQ